MATTTQANRRNNNRQSVMLVLEDPGLIHSLGRSLGAYGELIVTVCPALSHVAEAIPARRPDGFVVQVSCDQDLELAEDLAKTAGEAAVIALSPPAYADTAKRSTRLTVVNAGEDVAEIRRVLLSALVAAKWQAA